jgi:hypothetical protein
MRTNLVGLLLGTVSVLAVAAPARADAGLLGDFLGPRELGVGEARRADASGGAAVSLNPAGLALTHELVFEGSYGYRPFDKASLIGVSACDSTTKAPGCYYYHYAGSTPELDGMSVHRRTHVGGVTLARAISPRVQIGVGAKYINAKGAAMDGSEDRSGFNWDAGAVVHLTDVINVAAVGYNLSGTTNAEIARSFGSGISLRLSPELSAGFDAVWNLDTDTTTGRYGGGAEYFFSSADGRNGYPVRVGAVHDVATGTYVTGGLGITTLKYALDVGARRQVREGDELQVTASLRIFAPTH